MRARDIGFGIPPLLAAALVASCDEAPAAPEYSTFEEESALVSAFEPKGPRVEFADLEIFLEFNSTDNDLGVQVFLDAEGWDRVQARSPGGGNVLDFTAKKELGMLGITELRFESAEPSPAEVLGSIPPGTYTFVGRTVERGRLDGTAMLSHDLPPAASFTPEDDDLVDPTGLVIEWNAIPGLAGYEVIVANEDNGLSMEVELGPDATSLTVPSEFMEGDAEYKVEVLTIYPNGNKTIVEHVFTTTP